jgi:methylmalonyl-CoA/ethylmalonyl-CoA epimerase
MNEFKVHHFGLASNNLEKSMEVLRSLGYQIGETTFDPVQKATIAFASRPQATMVEIVCDADSDGPTGRIISKTGSGFYHICYEVDNIEKTIAGLRQLGFLLRHAPVPAVACGDRKIAWMYNRHVGLVELLEK